MDEPRHPRGRRSPRRVLLAAALSVSAVLVVAGCGDDGGSAAGLPDVPESEFEDLTGESAVDVAAVDNSFEPRYVRVSPGTEITFTNEGRNPHNVVPSEEGQFETIPTEDLEPGMSASLTFDEPGTYPYFCSLHGTATRGMVGRVVVEEG